MTNSVSDRMSEAWNLLWTDPTFEGVPIYLGVLAVVAILIGRFGYHSSGGGGDGGGDGGGGDGC